MCLSFGVGGIRLVKKRITVVSLSLSLLKSTNFDTFYYLEQTQEPKKRGVCWQ